MACCEWGELVIFTHIHYAFVLEGSLGNALLNFAAYYTFYFLIFFHSVTFLLTSWMTVYVRDMFEGYHRYITIKICGCDPKGSLLTCLVATVVINLRACGYRHVMSLVRIFVIFVVMTFVIVAIVTMSVKKGDLIVKDVYHDVIMITPVFNDFFVKRSASNVVLFVKSVDNDVFLFKSVNGFNFHRQVCWR